TYSILRFSNFAHGDFMAWGTYATLTVVGAIAAMFGKVAPIAPLSFGWPLIVALVVGVAFTALLALLLDEVLFSRLRKQEQAIIAVMGSFGASMALRSLLEFIFTSRPTYFSRAIQIAMPVGFGIRITPDQIALLILTAALVLGVHLLTTRTRTGRSMQAMSQNPALARIAGIDVASVVRVTWVIGAALA
ncbi:MAG: branched-chain amino acid ABC transporter permease, partial [Mesorhizobium sp.]